MSEFKNSDGPMVRARRIVEAHIEVFGMVPHPDRLKEAIATDLAFVELASRPHRDTVTEMRDSIEQALDDMGDDHCVCEATKQMLRAAIAKAIGSAPEKEG